MSSPLRALLEPVLPLSADMALSDVTDRFQQGGFERMLSLAVVDETNTPVGLISRHALMELLLNKYSRDLFGKRPIRFFMNAMPVIVSLSDATTDVISTVTSQIRIPIVEDFIFTEIDGTYAGMGSVADVLKMVEQRLGQRNQALAKANQEIKASQAHLIQSEKMAALGQMVAGVAHEINTPLGYVGNNVQMAQEMLAQIQVLLQEYEQLFDGLVNQTAEPQEIESRIQSIASIREDFDVVSDLADLTELFQDTRFGLKQIGEIVQSLKNFARVDRATTDRVNLIENIETALTVGQHHLKNKVTIEKRFELLPDVPCAPSQINQVLLNIFTNAAHAITHDRGRLLIRTYVRGEFACISIEDNGSGIPEEHVARIFEPFYTTKKVGEGTGLGLSISYRIIKDHGGDIRLATKEGIGTRFEISLPINGPAVSNDDNEITEGIDSAMAPDAQITAGMLSPNQDELSEDTTKVGSVQA
ncbi:sensor histidine kinase [Halothiobacillus sp.]|uniref:sensor histidine kinase n=1 Tax=Halothiobacillus sp. TaxID=1891311 RepID=UPI002AD5259B|nr:ATP-binding protein [Halothiobacillus sp.]